MTRYEFKLLKKEEQYSTTFKTGTFIYYHLEANKRFTLYAVHRFFVELEYNKKNYKIVN